LIRGPQVVFLFPTPLPAFRASGAAEPISMERYGEFTSMAQAMDAHSG